MTPGDTTFVKVAYRIDRPIADTWRAALDVSSWWEKNSRVFKDVRVLNESGVDRVLGVTWPNGVSQELAVKFDSFKHEIRIDFSQGNGLEDRIASCDVRLRPFLSDATLVEAELKLRNGFLKQLQELVLSPTSLVVPPPPGSRMRHLWEQTALMHREQSQIQMCDPSGSVHIIAVGVNTPRNNPFDQPEVRYAEHDADEFYHWALDTFGTNSDAAPIRSLLTGEHATSSAIGQELNDILDPRIVKPNDTVIFMYSGHMLLERPAHALTNEMAPFLQTANAQPGILTFTSIEREFVANQLNRSPACQTLFFADSCFGGGSKFTQEPGVPPIIGTRASSLPGITIAHDGKCITFGVDTFAQERANLEHGLLTYLWLKGVKGAANANGDGCVTFEELAQYVRDRAYSDSSGSEAVFTTIPQSLLQFPLVPRTEPSRCRLSP